MNGTGQLKKVTTRGIVAMILLGLEQGMSTGWPGQLGMVMGSDQEVETYAWLGTSPAMRKWVGGRNIQRLSEKQFDVKNLLFEASLGVSTDDLRRDKTGQLRVRIAQLVERANAHWASLLSGIIINGTTLNCYDGKKWFATDHVDGKSGAYKNLLAKTDYSELGIAAPANPTPYQFAQAVLKVIQHFYTMLDDNGEPLNENAQEFHIQVPPIYMAAATQALTLPVVETSSGTAVNPLQQNGMLKLSMSTNARLTAANWGNNFTVWRTDSAAKGAILQEEEGLTVKAIGEGSEYEILNNEQLFTLKAIRAVAPGYPQRVIKAGFTTP